MDQRFTEFKVLSMEIYATLFQFGHKGFDFLSKDKKRKYEPPVPTRVGKRKKKSKGPEAANKLPQGLSTNFSSSSLI